MAATAIGLRSIACFEAAKGNDRVADVLKAAADAIDQIDVENAQLRSALKSCADDLEAEVAATYKNATTGELLHPSYERRYKRDMSAVFKARELLGDRLSNGQ